MTDSSSGAGTLHWESWSTVCGGSRNVRVSGPLSGEFAGQAVVSVGGASVTLTESEVVSLAAIFDVLVSKRGL